VAFIPMAMSTPSDHRGAAFPDPGNISQFLDVLVKSGPVGIEPTGPVGFPLRFRSFPVLPTGLNCRVVCVDFFGPSSPPDVRRKVQSGSPWSLATMLRS